MQERACKLLIVDDSPEDRSIIKVRLEEIPGRAWNFTEEAKGERALERLARESFECILLDFQMPDCNGLEFLHELNARFGALHCPVVMFTGSGETAVAVSALKAGAQDYLSKDNFRADTLARAVDNAIEKVRLLRERDRHRADLEECNARLRLLEAAVEASSESIIITDAELDEPGPHIVFVNRAFTALTGYEAEEAIGQTPRILQGPRTNRAVLARLRQDLAERKYFNGETFNYRKDGGELTLDWAIAPIFDAEGTTTHFVGMQRDVSEQRKAEQEYRVSQGRYALALQSANVGTWDWDVATNTVRFDERWAGMLGYTLDELPPRFETWTSLVHPDDLGDALSNFGDHVSGAEEMYRAEFRMRARDGGWRWILALGKVQDRAPDGSPLRAVGTHLDVTDRHAMEESLERSNEDLRQFAYTISHDLQEPLRIIRTFSQLLEKRIGNNLDGESSHFLTTIQQRAGKGSKLIKDLLDFAQADADQQMANPVISLDEVLDSVLAGCTERLQASGAIVEREPLPAVQANFTQMEQLLQNLISNSFKYRHPGRPLKIRVSADRSNNVCRVSVADNGIGFPPEKSDVIFGLFKRLHEIDQPGTGIGLAITKRIVERYGGQIWAESLPGVGSTFHFTIPLRAAMAANV